MAEVTFLPSERGGRLVTHNNFLYRFHSSYKGKTFWRCATYEGCRARVCLVNEKIHRVNGCHTHEPATYVIEKRKFNSKLVKRVQKDVATPVSKIYKEEVEALSTNGEIPLYLPSYKNIESNLYRARSTSRVTMVHNDDNEAEPWKRSVYGESFISSKKGETSNSTQQSLAAETCSDSEDEMSAGPVKTDVSACKKGEKQKFHDEQTKKPISYLSKITTPADQQDEFHELGIKVAEELRTMHPEQQMFVKSIINRALSFGNSGQLIAESDIYPTSSCSNDYLVL